MKKLFSLILVIAMTAGLFVTPALAAPKVPAAEPEEGAREAVILEKNPFHCNTFGGNGRAYAELFEEKLAADKALKKAGIGGVNEGIIYLSDNAWMLENTTDYVCSVCGRTEWVSFSNKSGVPNGKNMQFTHAAPVNYTEILKQWDDGTGIVSDEAPEGVKAIFDIFEYDGTNNEDGTPKRGELVISDAEPGVRYSIEPGTYVVAERVKDGYVVQPDQVITVTYDKSATVTFVNEPIAIPSGVLTLLKTVDGEPINVWEVEIDGDTITMDSVAEDIKFNAYAVAGDGAEYDAEAAPYADATLGLEGEISFGELPTGWYVVVENFTEGSTAAKIFKAPKEQYFFIDVDGNIIAGAFNFDGDWTEPEKTFTKVNAVAASDYVMDEDLVDAAVAAPGNSHVGARANVANAFGPADALQNAGNNLFTGLAFFPEGVTYYFGDDENSIQDIYNNPDEALPDISFIEVTWSNNWHTEAVDVYLQNVLLDGEKVPVDSLYIGRVFNRKDLASHAEGEFGFAIKTVGNFTYTDVFFPSNVIKASSVRLVDATTDVNTPTPTYNTWKTYDDGYDLDAMVAYYTLPSNAFENKIETDPPADPLATVTVSADVEMFKDVENYTPDYEKEVEGTIVSNFQNAFDIDDDRAYGFYTGGSGPQGWFEAKDGDKLHLAQGEDHTIIDDQLYYEIAIDDDNVTLTFFGSGIKFNIAMQVFGSTEDAKAKGKPGHGGEGIVKKDITEEDNKWTCAKPEGNGVFLVLHIDGMTFTSNEVQKWDFCCNGDPEICTLCAIPTLTAKLCDADGNPIEIEGEPVEAELGGLEGLYTEFTKLDLGEYTVKLFAGETELGEQDVTLETDGEIVDVVFTGISLRCKCDTVENRDEGHSHI